MFKDTDPSLGAYNLIPISVLDMLIREAPNMTVLYLDNDMTLQRFSNAIPFTNTKGGLSRVTRDDRYD